MAKDEPESRPIPVSELLARQREANRASAETGAIPRVSFPRSANPVAQRAERPQADEPAVSVSRTASRRSALRSCRPSMASSPSSSCRRARASGLRWRR